MAGATARRLFCLLSLLLGAWLASAQERPKTSKELFEYINDARKLGLKDDQIRKNALGAGWDQSVIDQTYSIVRLLNNEKPADGDGASSAPLRLPDGYRIGAGDALQIVVWKEPEASVPQAVVRADGKISMPLIKDVDAVGLTPRQLEESLADKLSKFINGPDVTVVAKEIRSLKVYIMGGVKKEGPVTLLSPMTVLQVINEAGGLTDYAKRKKIYILRRDENGKQIRLPFDYQAVIKGEQPAQNIFVMPNDTVVVPN